MDCPESYTFSNIKFISFRVFLNENVFQQKKFEQKTKKFEQKHFLMAIQLQCAPIVMMKRPRKMQQSTKEEEKDEK